MNKETEDILLVFVVIILVIAVMVLVFSSGRKTGLATSTTSQVVINAYVAIALSTELGSGIDFGAIDELPANDVGAVENFDAGDQTLYSVDVSSNSNIAADICIRAEGPMSTVGGDTIPLANYDWSHNVGGTDINNPSGPPGTDMSVTYAAAGTNVGRGNSDYFRFWLTIAGGQAAGTYSNTVWFQGVPTGTSC